MSDSETDVPPEATISDGIRDIVISTHKAGNQITVRQVRNEAEEKLGLPLGYLKDGDWKDKSKDLIHEAVERYCGDEPASTPPKKATKAKAKAKPEPKTKTKTSTVNAPRVKKRKAAAPAKKLTKRTKTADSDKESDAVLSDSGVEDHEPSDAESEPPKPAARRQKEVVAEESDEDESAPPKSVAKESTNDDEEMQGALSVKAPEQPATPGTSAPKDDAESDMSDVLDESPAKSRRKSKTEKPSKATKSAKSRSQPKAAKAKVEDTPDQAEIKRLQGWLVKCGIRKVWGKELQSCETPKDKIRHLKDMLKDAGMDGKYSVEKAAKIKEQREFAKDLEEIQAGAAAWGETSTGRPRRAAAARPVQPVTLPEDSDEEDGADGARKSGEDEGSDDDDDVQGESGSDTGGSGGDDDDGDDSG